MSAPEPIASERTAEVLEEEGRVRIVSVRFPVADRFVDVELKSEFDQGWPEPSISVYGLQKIRAGAAAVAARELAGAIGRALSEYSKRFGR